MENILADTHAIIWYAEDNKKLGSEARNLLDQGQAGKRQIYLSLMSLFEMEYLIGKGKIDSKLPKLLLKNAKNPHAALQILNIDQDVYRHFTTISHDLIPELPDRIITASALAKHCILLTRDTRIRESKLVKTAWA